MHAVLSCIPQNQTDLCLPFNFYLF